MKRSEHLAPVSREHHYTLLFSWKLRMGISGGIAHERIFEYITYFWELILQSHLEHEERYLFADKEDVLIKQALGDHLQLRELVTHTLRQKDKHDRDILQLADLVERHTRFEERVLFPHLEKSFSDRKLKRIGDSLSVNAGLLKDEYSDPFWMECR